MHSNYYRLGNIVFKFRNCRLCYNSFNSKVPKEPYTSSFKDQSLSDVNEVNLETITHLERLSLVNFGNLKGVEILESSIQFAGQLLAVDASGVEPLTTVLEKQVLPLRDDVVADGNCCKRIISNAKTTEEEYFVAPPGNIPLEIKNQDLLKESKKAGKCS